MRRSSAEVPPAQINAGKRVPRHGRQSRRAYRPALRIERLEDRLLHTVAPGSDSNQWGQASGHGICSCPICTGVGLHEIPTAEIATSVAAQSQRSQSPLSSLPRLSSNASAKATLFLDFDGHVEHQWGDHTNVVTPAYDTDGNPTSFSATEVAAIREVWARVAEDYAPFNINVTTLAPSSFSDRVSARVAIGGSSSDWYGATAGGVAYVGGYYNGAPNVAYVFSRTLGGGNPRFVAEAASHEAGHLFGLQHHSEWSGSRLVTEYDSGSTQWAPIMGVGYYADRSTWSNTQTVAGPTAYQNDLTLIASATNGFGYVPDDFGNAISTATALPLSGTAVNVAGLIGKNDDRDVFKFTTSGGPINFSLAVAQYGPNLDAMLELQNSAGKTIVAASPASTFGASLTSNVAAGTYYLLVRSIGGYGDVGRYTVQGTVTAPANPIKQPPPTAPTQEKPAGESRLPPVAPGIRIVDNGNSSFSSVGAWKTITGAGYSSDTQISAAGSNSSSTWTFSGLAPGQYRVAATWNGTSLNAKDAPFSISSGNKLLSTIRVNQQRSASTFTSAGASWQNLGTFTITGNSITIRLNSTAKGRVVADAIRLERVFPTSGGSTYLPPTLAEPLSSPIVVTSNALLILQETRVTPTSALTCATGGVVVNADVSSSGSDRDVTNRSLHGDKDNEHGFTLPAVDAALADADWLHELQQLSSAQQFTRESRQTGCCFC
jgi:hypothetical protein